MLAHRKEIELHGLWKESTQGDRFIAELASSFGIETRWDEHGITIVGNESQLIVHPECLNLSSYPDLAIPLIVACAVNYPQISFCGIEHLEWKESKRITALQTELQKVGLRLIYEHSILRFDQSAMLPASYVDFCSHGDHRIVMALSMLALKGWQIQFDETDCVKKSFPDFFDQLKTLGFEFGNDRQHVG
jgi:3-phosphoshikimate 1-carboxyvinyltransferase